jgi:hypothetical protein
VLQDTEIIRIDEMLIGTQSWMEKYVV